MNFSIENHTFSGYGSSGSSGSSNMFIGSDDNIEQPHHGNTSSIVAMCIFLSCIIFCLGIPISILFGDECVKRPKKTYEYPSYYNDEYSSDSDNDNDEDDNNNKEFSFEIIVISFLKYFSNNVKEKDLNDDCIILLHHYLLHI